MDERVAILRVVIASPADVQAERDLVPEVLEELNRSVARERGIHLAPVRWETDSYPGFHPLGPQGLIDPILRLEDCDILIGIFWKRFGTPISSGEAGTEHEIRRAFEYWKVSGRPQIMVYFNGRSYTPRTKEETDQWGRVLEFRDKFPEQGLLARYKGKAQFRELLRNHLSNYLQEQYPIHSTKTQRSSQNLDQGDYFAVQSRVIAEYERSFVGRAEVQNEFDAFLKNETRGYFIVRGGPGQGKTALSCHLIHGRGYAHHLVSRSGGRTDTRLILRSLLAQLRPSGENSEIPESPSDLVKFFEETLLSAASRQKPLVVVIDALDELPAASGEAPYLVSDALPDGVFFFVTCRPGDRLDRIEERLFATPHRFHDLGPLTLVEIRSVLQASSPGVTAAETERIAEASQGNPLYLRAVAEQLKIRPAYNLAELPATIEGFYSSSTAFLPRDNAALRDVLGLLSVARTSLSVRELSAITGRSQREIDDQGIGPIRQFLLGIGNSYVFYHMKFHEFVTRNVLYEDELGKSHGSIALWLQRPDNRRNPYRWASLAYHMFESGDHAGLLEAVTPAFVVEKVRRLGYAVLEDIEFCVRSLLETGDSSVIERCVAMVESAREIVGGDIVPDAARALQPYRAGPQSFRTKVIEPEVPSVPGVRVYVGVLPKAEVPADFFEVVARGDRLAVAMGDVPAIGLKSAFAARFIGNLFHRFCEGTDELDLSDIVQRINSTVVNHEYFRRISIQCLEIDPVREIVHITSAGHPYPVHYSAVRAKCDILPVRGDLLHDYATPSGDGPVWQQYGLEVASGDIIVLISDGLTEGHLLEGDPYGYRFTEVIGSRAGEGPRAIGEAILDDWKAHLREEDSADDVSVVVIALDSRGSR